MTNATQVQPIAVASKDYAAGTQALITGWGKTNGGPLGQIPDTLQYAYTNLISKAECQATWGSQVTDRMQCPNNNARHSYEIALLEIRNSNQESTIPNLTIPVLVRASNIKKSDQRRVEKVIISDFVKPRKEL